MALNWWVILGYGLLGLILGTLTGTLLMLKRKAWAGVVFFVGSGLGWSLVFGAGAVVNHLLFHAACYPLDVMAYKAGGLCGMVASLTGIGLYRRLNHSRRLL